MGRSSENRIKFSKPSLTAIERRINSGEFTKESYLYAIWLYGSGPINHIQIVPFVYTKGFVFVVSKKVSCINGKL